MRVRTTSGGSPSVMAGLDPAIRIAPYGAPRNDCWSLPLDPDLHRRAIADRLINDAITLGQLEKLIELVPRRVGIEVEAEPDLRKAHRCVLGDAERAAEVEVAFGRHHS